MHQPTLPFTIPYTSIRQTIWFVMIVGQLICTRSWVGAADWGRMLGPNDDAQSPNATSRFESTEKIPIAWNIDVGTGYGNAVIADGRMFHLDRYADKERLTCYNAADGVERWRIEWPVEYADSFGYNDGPRAMPTANADFVAAYGVTGHLVVANAKNGQLLWEKECSRDYGVIPNFFGVGSTPRIYQDKLLVMIGGSPDSQQRRGYNISALNQLSGQDSGIVAFNLKDGQEQFRVGKYLASYSAPVVHNINGSDVGLALMREGLMAFDPASGVEIDFYPFRASINESVNAAWPVVHNNEVFISETYELGSRLLRLEKDGFSELWRDPLSRREQSIRAHWATPVLIDGVLYGCSGRNTPDADLRAVRWQTGEVLWSERTHARANVMQLGEFILFLDEYGKLQLLEPNPAELKVVAEVDLMEIRSADAKPILGLPIWAPATFVNGLLVLRGDNRLVGLQLDQ